MQIHKHADLFEPALLGERANALSNIHSGWKDVRIYMLLHCCIGGVFGTLFQLPGAKFR